MDKLDMQTPNLADRNYEILAKLFPNAITETIDENGEVVRAIDADVLRQEISCKVVEGKEERYQFTWPDKKQTMMMTNIPVQGTLRPLRNKSVSFDNTENLYIEGDNLETLKLLQECYLGKVKIIYIDPPYNTGNDFVYVDDFSEDVDTYIARSGQVDEIGNRLVKNVDSNGRFHTDWLNMIYSRLKLAKNLLSDDGYIFISIDDNEIENLKKICNEIFGEVNYINNFAWVSNITGRQISGRGAAKTWESVLVYAKDAVNATEFNVNISFAKEKMPDTYKGFNKDIRRDERGEFAVGDTLYIAITGPFSSLSVNAKEVYNRWIEEKKCWGKDSGRMYTHNVISFHKDEAVTPQDVLDIGKEFAERFFSGYQCVISVHQDRDHLHCHIVSNTVSYINGKKLHQSKHDLEEQKAYTNLLCKQKGLKIAEKGHHFDNSLIAPGEVTTWSKDKYNLLLRDKDRSNVSRCASDILQAILDTEDEETFIDIMRQKGWKVTKKPNDEYQFKDEAGNVINSNNLRNTLQIDIITLMSEKASRETELETEEEDYEYE